MIHTFTVCSMMNFVSLELNLYELDNKNVCNNNNNDNRQQIKNVLITHKQLCCQTVFDVGLLSHFMVFC